MKKKCYVLGHQYPYTDIDSIVSSVVLAAYYNYLNCDVEAVLLPCASIAGSTLRILAAMDGKMIMPEIVEPSALYAANTGIILVDHSDMNQSFGHYQACRAWVDVIDVIDHHIDQEVVLPDRKPKPTMYRERVGSTCTLVYQLICNEGHRAFLDDKWARYLAYGIATDTKGFQSRKYSDADRKAIEDLATHFDLGDHINTIAEDCLINSDLSKTPEELLVNSYKEYFNGLLSTATVERVSHAGHEAVASVVALARKLTFKSEIHIFIDFRQYCHETQVHIFDKKGRLPSLLHYPFLASRSQDIVPLIEFLLKSDERLH